MACAWKWPTTEWSWSSAAAREVSDWPGGRGRCAPNRTQFPGCVRICPAIRLPFGRREPDPRPRRFLRMPVLIGT
jgi:hypothetical protein